MKGNLLIILVVSFLAVSCSFHEKKGDQIVADEPLLFPLDSGVVFCKDKWSCKELLELTGEKILEMGDSLNFVVAKEVDSLSFKSDQVIYHSIYRNEKEKISIGEDDFIYTRDSSIIGATIIEDSIQEQKIYDLLMHPSNGWLVANSSKNRIVFAYEYYHIIQIIDLETETVRILDFKNGDHYYDHVFDTRICMGCRKPHVLYYQGVFAGENHFYVLYWGYSLAEFQSNVATWRRVGGKQQSSKMADYEANFPNIVEKYDWNGKRIARYLLKGHPALINDCFIVDEKNKQFYLLASYCDDHFMIDDLWCNITLVAYPFE